MFAVAGAGLAWSADWLGHSGPVAHQATQFTLTLRSEDNGATFQGSGQDSVGNTAVSVTARHKGTPPAPPDQVACKP